MEDIKVYGMNEKMEQDFNETIDLFIKKGLNIMEVVQTIKRANVVMANTANNEHLKDMARGSLATCVELEEFLRRKMES